MTERNALEKAKRLDNIKSIVNALFFFLLCLCVLASGWLAKNVFKYETVIEKTRYETYTEKTGETIETFICYTTDYGDCYHSKECGYLWNSSYKTTVYEAIQEGYCSCSKCEPTEKTTYYITEIRSTPIKYQETIEEYPIIEVFIISVASLLALYLIITLIISRRYKEKKQ